MDRSGNPFILSEDHPASLKKNWKLVAARMKNIKSLPEKQWNDATALMAFEDIMKELCKELYRRFGNWLKTDRNVYYTIAAIVAVGLLIVFG